MKYPTNDKNVIDLECSYFNTDEFSWVRPLELEWEAIKNELEEYTKSEGLASFSQGYSTLVEGSWTALPLIFWNLKRNNSTFFPKTMSMFEQIPHCTSISFSQLAAGSVIKPHFGENNAYYRCHLALTVPAQLPDLGFRVGGEEREWQEGKVLVFNDAKMHSAFNFSDHNRTIVIFDVWRDEYIHCYKEAVLHQLAIYALFFELKLVLNCNPFNQNEVYWYNAKEKLSPKMYSRHMELYQFFSDHFIGPYFDNAASEFFFDLWDKSGGV